MSVSSNDRRYGITNITGAGQTLSADFRIQADADVLVWFYDASAASARGVLDTANWSALTLTTHYTITGKSDSGFNVVLGGAIGASGDKALVLDKRVFKTYTSFTGGDSLPPETLQKLAIDCAIEDLQKLSEIVGRALQLPPHSTSKTTPDQTSTGTQWPDYPSDATTVQMPGYDPSDGSLNWYGAADFSAATVTSFMLTLLDDTTAGAALTTLGISAFVQTILDDADAGTVRSTIGAAAAPSSAFVEKDGSVTMTGALPMGTNKITGMGDPTSAQDAATKAYADGLASSTLSEVNPGKYVAIKDDFIISTTVNSGDALCGELGWDILVSGTSAAVSVYSTGVNNHPGWVSLATGTDTGGLARIIQDSRFRTGDGAITIGWIVDIGTLADATNDYELLVGAYNSTTTTDGIYFKYDRDTGANWLICAQASSTETATSSGVAVGTDPVHLRMEINAAGTSITYYIDDVSVGTVSTNVPSTTTDLRNVCQIVKEAGSTSRLFLADLFYFQQTLTTSR